MDNSLQKLPACIRCSKTCRPGILVPPLEYLREGKIPRSVLSVKHFSSHSPLDIMAERNTANTEHNSSHRGLKTEAGRLSPSTLANVPDSTKDFAIQRYLKTPATDEQTIYMADRQEREASLKKLISQVNDSLVKK
ncbi:hypothetical protein VTN31DRAFT_2897 [Thermomyces dupontii]|uniref:uncharacterized protein n=1 Tax=Talaromyces thermophilus TaxID=28565 RepID=UPI0037440BE9